MKIRAVILVLSLLLVSGNSWGKVFVRWTESALPPANALGIDDVVISWADISSPLLAESHKRGYHIYLETTPEQAGSAAEKAEQEHLFGIILKVRESDRANVETDLQRLQAGHPKIRFLVLNSDGKRPQMRGSLVIKRNSVLEVSSPTAQPWIDSNLALIKIQTRAYPRQDPLYTFSWHGSDSGQAPAISADDYSIAVAEAGAFHADVVLDVDEGLQKALVNNDPKAWNLWKQVQSYEAFYSEPSRLSLQPATNVAVIVDEFDTGDEAMNLLARHNIPFSVLQPSDLKTEDLESSDLIVVLAKTNDETTQRIADLATRGKTIVIVDAKGSYPWHKNQSLRLNEHTVSYTLGTGKVLELSDSVSDPETFAQDIHRLIGKERMLISIWNGLTTIAVPYHESNGKIALMEFVNYAADPLRVQVQVKGSFGEILYETPEHKCCESLAPVNHDGFTEFVVPELRIAGRVYLKAQPSSGSR